MKINQPKPGRYTPQCPKCSQRLLIVVSDDPSEPPSVVVVKEKAKVHPAETVAPAAKAKPAATAAFTAKVASDRTKGEPADPSATADFAPPKSASRPAATGAPRSAARAGTGAPGVTDALGTGGGPAATGLPTTPPPSKAGAESTGFNVAPQPAAGELSGTLGGYQLVKQLGRGGMGAVYLARQMSLDRNVAVKVMRTDWARDPVFVARFTREAYAAAQLVHHHVVQIYDIGVERQQNYFSMELVDGKSLADVLQEQGKIDVEVAVGYILQAARGLAFAHQQGMVHRDIKPDNLLINSHGMVKVADLGIVKVPGATGAAEESRPASSTGSLAASASNAVTMAGVAMGTPHFMAPEQARDSASVDARADIYSLGCTLYMLITGQPPFAGKTAMEVITKHASEPVVPPDAVVKRVPKELSEIILKMVAKQPADRYASMTEVIKALEGFLGVESNKPFSPREEHAQALEEAASGFYAPPLAKLRGKLVAGYFGALLLLTLITAFLSASLAIGCLGLMAMTPLAYLVIAGVTQKTFIFSKTRELIFTAGIGGWLKGAAAALMLLVILFALGWLWVWIGAGVAAVLIALGYYMAIDRPVQRARRTPLDNAEQLLKKLRLNGLEEDALRQFICKYSGQQWEEFYEALFGYEAKLQARSRWGLVDRGTTRPKHAAWRDRVVRWIDARVTAKKLARERKHLAAMEEMGLRATGVEPAEAKRLAEEKTKVLIAKVKSARVKATEEPSGNRWMRMLGRLVGPQVRFFGGAAVLALSLLWAHQNQLIRAEELQSVGESAMQQAQQGQVDDSQVETTKKLAGSWLERARKAKPLELPLVPTSITGFFSHLCVAGAGLLLVISSIQSRRVVIAGFLLAAIGLFAAQWVGLP
ncbi:MAG TPA: serine/threonine-protein kinase [Pirellulales bacterium]|jgi:tRNA A-37 threonylcarbamoyl transferase component Bud32|nr:serine/threonine-protein kinase [Pirellulales bacterium]